MDLITLNLEKKIREEGPLAQRMRPDKIDRFLGQAHLLAHGKPLRKMIEADNFASLIFYGPPGTGKTSLAKIIAAATRADFNQLNAVAAGVKDVREVIEQAGDNWSMQNRRTILFIDEIHRFNKAQQDVLLAAIEKGTVIFIGATTENPFFYLTRPLLSRTALFQFESLQKEDLTQLIRDAVKNEERGLGKLQLKIEPGAIDYLADKANGDARSALNGLETAVLIGEEKDGQIVVTAETAAEAMQKRLLSYDRQGDNHYDMASAMIKSIRGSDPHAAIYWMARMLKGGEDPLFIARRLMISASEDIGNADPQALPLAVAAAQAVQMIGLPEGRIPLAQAITYLASVPKSNASYLAINEASRLVEEEENRPVPTHLKSSSYAGAKRLGHGEGYRYPHDYPGHYIKQDYLPPALKGKKLYRPTELGSETELKNYLDSLEKNNSINPKSTGKEHPHGR